MQNDREFNPQSLDEIIDAALPDYSAIEPRPGLERRILAHAAAVQQMKRSPLLNWASALAVFALAAAVLVLLGPRLWHQSVPNPEPPTVSSIEATTLPRPAVSAKTVRSRILRSPAKHKIQALPMQDVFPSPSSLTAEEQALVAYSRAQFQTLPPTPTINVDIDPIHVAELQIKPLTIPALNTPASSQSESGRNDQNP